jgi:polyferredoxin
MDTSALEIFIYSPYNRVADIKMLKFFSEISTFSLVVLISLFFLTILLRHFWCRYLCPYGALLGVLSLFSMTRIRRNKTTCIGCEKCTIACPSNIKVHRSGTVHSDECHACMKCIDICPVPNTISFSLREKGGIIRPWIYATLILIIFAGGSSLAKATGYWQNAVPIREYLFHVQHLHLPMYHHNRGSVPEYNPNLFSRPDRISKMRFQNGMEVYDETHRNPRKRASSNSSGA